MVDDIDNYGHRSKTLFNGINNLDDLLLEGYICDSLVWTWDGVTVDNIFIIKLLFLYNNISGLNYGGFDQSINYYSNWSKR